MTAFADLGLSDSTLQALQDVGYESPSPIQEQAIPPMLEGRDVIGQAQTGSGKTAAFGLPIIESLVRRNLKQAQALVLCPTRELALQITGELSRIGKGRQFEPVAIYGGAPMERQSRALAGGAQVWWVPPAGCSTT